MLQLLDHFIIAVPHVFDEGDDPSGFKKLNVAFYIDKERDRYERKIRKGVVHNVPMVFREINHMPIDPGLPTPRLYVNHDTIQKMINQGYRWSNAQYHPGAREGYDYITVADYGRKITAKVGDEVYFHPSVTEEENYIGREGDALLYKAQVHEVICIGDVPQGGYIIVAPVATEQARDGLLLSVDEQDNAQMGIVKYARPGCGLLPGQEVYYQENSNWDFWLGEERYFAMLEENIVGVKQTGAVDAAPSTH